MLGFNGGLMGVRKVPTTGSASGLWVPNEQSVAKRAGIWPYPYTGDPYFANVSVLLHMNGSNGSTTFTDSSSYAHAVTPRGNAQISTEQSKFGGAAGFFDGTSDGLSVAENDALKLGTGDFTIELQAYRTGTGSKDRFLVELGNGAGYLLRWASNGNLQFYIQSSLACFYTFSFTLNTWYHLAVARSGSSVKMFVDGSEVASGTSSNSASANSNVGISSNQAGTSDYFQGYLDEVRITKGVARYTANFTPPTAPFPDA